jgi:hypothetical protein
LKIFFTISIILISLKSFSQGYTKEHFFLSVDDYVINDTIHTLVLTKDQVLKLKKVHTNFSWAHVKSFTVYFSSLNSSDALPTICNGDVICEEMKKLYKYVGENSVLTFVAKVENNQGKEVEWGSFSIVIK